VDAFVVTAREPLFTPKDLARCSQDDQSKQGEVDRGKHSDAAKSSRGESVRRLRRTKDTKAKKSEDRERRALKAANKVEKERRFPEPKEKM